VKEEGPKNSPAATIRPIEPFEGRKEYTEDVPITQPSKSMDEEPEGLAIQASFFEIIAGLFARPPT
jgi:hypothetical protein